jgi:hypothetical protein
MLRKPTHLILGSCRTARKLGNEASGLLEALIDPQITRLSMLFIVESIDSKGPCSEAFNGGPVNRIFRWRTYDEM